MVPYFAISPKNISTFYLNIVSIFTNIFHRLHAVRGREGVRREENSTVVYGMIYSAPLAQTLVGGLQVLSRPVTSVTRETNKRQ